MMSAGWSNAYGSFTRRATARFIDLAVVLLVCASFYLADFELGFPLKYSTLFEYRPALSFYIFMTYDFPGVSMTFIAVKLFLVFPYFALMESGRWQGTLGKRLMDINVTGLDGDRISFGRATARYFLKTISAVLFMLGYLISFSDKRQTLHDYLARTLVLKRNVSPVTTQCRPGRAAGCSRLREYQPANIPQLRRATNVLSVVIVKTKDRCTAETVARRSRWAKHVWYWGSD